MEPLRGCGATHHSKTTFHCSSVFCHPCATVTTRDSKPINHLLRRRGLVVSPSALEESHHAKAGAGRQSGYLCKFDLDGVAFADKPGPLQQNQEKAAQLRKVSSRHRRRRCRRLASGASLLFEPAGASDQSLAAGRSNQTT